MSLSDVLGRVFSPPAEVSTRDSGLTFTDILFGFVISQLFIRLQNWGTLQWVVRWQLIAGTALVLGSWIGFRRSRNRSRYELKFFNLPLLRFLLDQVMVVLYFRVAVLTPTGARPSVNAHTLVQKTTFTIMIVFGLYVLWDVGAIWMARARDPRGPKHAGAPKYPAIEHDAMTSRFSKKDWIGLVITAITAVAIAAVFVIFKGITIRAKQAELAFVLEATLLIGYRWAKEIRSSLRPASNTTEPEVLPGTVAEPAQ